MKKSSKGEKAALPQTKPHPGRTGTLVKQASLFIQLIGVYNRNHCFHLVYRHQADSDKGEELIDKIIPLAEQVAEEKGHPGVITRDLFLALKRSVH